MSTTHLAGHPAPPDPRETDIPPRPLRITAGALAATLVACWGEYPDAAHGLLGARDDDLVQPLLHGVEAVPDATACTARLSDDQCDRGLRTAGHGLTVGATFHAHLAHPATPTARDREHLLAHPHLPLLIVSLQDVDAPDIRAWRLAHDDVVAVPLQLVAPDPHPPSR